MEKDTIILGDFRDYLADIPADAFFISDPPYNQGYHYDAYGDTLEAKEYENMLFAAFSRGGGEIGDHSLPRRNDDNFRWRQNGEGRAIGFLGIPFEHRKAISSCCMVRV